MCQGSAIQFWCPCSVQDENHRAFGLKQRQEDPESFDLSHSDAEGLRPVSGHAVARIRDTGAYIWCDAYFSSAESLPSGQTHLPPQRAKMPSRSDNLHALVGASTTALCSFCEERGCSLAREPPRSLYGRQPRAQRIEAKAKRKKQKLIDGEYYRATDSPAGWRNTFWAPNQLLREAERNPLSWKFLADGGYDAGSEESVTPTRRTISKIFSAVVDDQKSSKSSRLRQVDGLRALKIGLENITIRLPATEDRDQRRDQLGLRDPPVQFENPMGFFTEMGHEMEEQLIGIDVGSPAELGKHGSPIKQETNQGDCQREQVLCPPPA